ncbi:hypothetical protein BH18ACT2_BH18ACT2_10610 [soil metagenome]
MVLALAVLVTMIAVLCVIVPVAWHAESLERESIAEERRRR